MSKKQPVKTGEVEDALHGVAVEDINTKHPTILKKPIAFPVSRFPQNQSWFTMAVGSCCGLGNPIVIPRGSFRVHQRHLDDMFVDSAYQRFLSKGLRPGYGVITAVIDGGIIDHPDLQNVDRELSNTFFPYPFNGRFYPDPKVEIHGTACAGVVGAQGRAYVNGVAPFCGLVDLNINGRAENIARAVQFRNDVIDVYSISQGQQGAATPFAVDNTMLNIDTRKLSEAILTGLNEGRSGKGCIYIFSAGNKNLNGMEATLDNFKNVPVGSITVGAMNPMNELSSSYSAAGSNILCAGIAGNDMPQLNMPQNIVQKQLALSMGIGVITTGPYPTAPVNQSFNGTSCACPGISGVATLLLSFARGMDLHLSYRDVKHLIMLSCDWPVEVVFLSSFGHNPNTTGLLAAGLPAGQPKRNQMGRWFSNTFGYGRPNSDKLMMLTQAAKDRSAVFGPQKVEIMAASGEVEVKPTASATKFSWPLLPVNLIGQQEMQSSMVLEEVEVSIDGMFRHLCFDKDLEMIKRQLVSLTVAVEHLYVENGTVMTENSFLLGSSTLSSLRPDEKSDKWIGAANLLRQISQYGPSSPMRFKTEAFRGSRLGGLWRLFVARKNEEMYKCNAIVLTEAQIRFYGHDPCEADSLAFK